MKIVYQVRVIVPSHLHDDWLKWMTTKHISEVVTIGGFESAEMLEELSIAEPHTPGSSTYVIRYTCDSMDVLREYQNTHASGLQAEHTDRYGTEVTATRIVFALLKRFE